MSDDLLGTVKAELDELEHDVDCPCHGDITPHSWECANCECYLSNLRALVDRCEQAEAEVEAERIENRKLREAFVVMERAANEHEAEVERLRGQLSAAHDVHDIFARDLNRMVENCDKDTMAHDALVASLTDELRRAKAKADQYQIDWMAAKAEFGDKLAALRQRYNDKDTEMRGVLADIDERDATIRDLRQRHAEVVEKAFYEGWDCYDEDTKLIDAWLASEAKQGLG